MSVSFCFGFSLMFSRKFELTLTFLQLLSVIQNYGSDLGASFKPKTILSKEEKIHRSIQIFALKKNLNSKDLRRICFSCSFYLFLSLLYSITVKWSLREKKIKINNCMRGLWKEVFHFGVKRRELHLSVFAHWTA